VTPPRDVLDTSMLIGGGWESEPDRLLAVSAVSLAELHFGALLATDETVRALRQRRLAEVEAAFVPLPVDARVARAYAELAVALVRAGRAPRRRVADLLIAATARVHGARLLTRNPADLVGLEGLVEVAAPA